MALLAACSTDGLDDWLDVDLAAEPGSWGMSTAASVLARPDSSGHDGSRRRLAARLERVAASVTASGAAAAYVLLPAADLQVRTVARLLTLDLPADMAAQSAQDHVLAALTPPADRVSGQVTVSDLATPAGAAQRLELRLSDAGEDGDTEMMSIVWVFTADATAVLLTMAFLTRLEATHWRPGVEALARTLHVTR